MADWIEDYYEWGEPVYLRPLRERIRENQFLDAIQVPQFVELSPSVVEPADPCGRQRPRRLAAKDIGLSRR
jgi:hypothetical protein